LKQQKKDLVKKFSQKHPDKLLIKIKAKLSVNTDKGTESKLKINDLAKKGSHLSEPPSDNRRTDAKYSHQLQTQPSTSPARSSFAGAFQAITSII